MFTAITDHLARALGRLRLQFRNSVDFYGTLAALTSEVQACEDAIAAVVLQFRDVSTATGNLLIRIGALVGAPSKSANISDADYRTIVSGQILLNKSAGLISDLYAIATATVESIYGYAWEVLDADPNQTNASLGLRGGVNVAVVVPTVTMTAGLDIDYAQAVVPLFTRVAPAGMRVIFVYRPRYFVGGTTDNGDGIMRCDSSGGAVCDNKFVLIAAPDRA
jgi:hypothetical protein